MDLLRNFVYEFHEDSKEAFIAYPFLRRHQIRLHLAAAGFPVLGDDTYGGVCCFSFPRFLLTCSFFWCKDKNSLCLVEYRRICLESIKSMLVCLVHGTKTSSSIATAMQCKSALTRDCSWQLFCLGCFILPRLSRLAIFAHAELSLPCSLKPQMKDHLHQASPTVPKSPVRHVWQHRYGLNNWVCLERGTTARQRLRNCADAFCECF